VNISNFIDKVVINKKSVDNAKKEGEKKKKRAATARTINCQIYYKCDQTRTNYIS
jgi:hypothetical protein